MYSSSICFFNYTTFKNEPFFKFFSSHFILTILISTVLLLQCIEYLLRTVVAGIIVHWKSLSNLIITNCVLRAAMILVLATLGVIHKSSTISQALKPLLHHQQLLLSFKSSFFTKVDNTKWHQLALSLRLGPCPETLKIYRWIN